MKKSILFTILTFCFAAGVAGADPQDLVYDMGDGTTALFVKSNLTCKSPMVPCRALVGGGAARSQPKYKTLCVSLANSQKVNCGKRLPMSSRR